MSQYTLVRHSAYTVGGNADFEGAVEVRELNTHQAYRVRAASGALFTTLAAAQSAATQNNYPNGPTPSAPSVAGYFSNLCIGGAEIYVPPALPNDSGAAAGVTSRTL